MDIMAYIADKTANHQDASLDDTKIQEILSDNKSYVKTAKTTSFITTKGEYEIPYSELYTASDKTPSDPVTTAINYGSKTAETITVGDDITIGTERFKVLKNDGTKIQAIPYYNITLTDEPIQSPDAGTIHFGSIYTDGSGNGIDYVSVDMSSQDVMVQKYIIAYQKHFQKLGLTNVSTRIIDFNNDSFSENLNPSQTGKYWLGTRIDWGEDAHILVILENGDFSESYISTDSGVGVRPLIEISL